MNFSFRTSVIFFFFFCVYLSPSILFTFEEQSLIVWYVIEIIRFRHPLFSLLFEYRSFLQYVFTSFLFIKSLFLTFLSNDRLVIFTFFFKMSFIPMLSFNLYTQMCFFYISFRIWFLLHYKCQKIKFLVRFSISCQISFISSLRNIQILYTFTLYTVIFMFFILSP